MIALLMFISILILLVFIAVMLVHIDDKLSRIAAALTRGAGDGDG